MNSVFMPNHRVDRKEYLIASVTWASSRHQYFRKLLANYQLELEGVTKGFNEKILELRLERSEHFKRTEEDTERYSPSGPIKGIDEKIKSLVSEVNDLSLNLQDSISNLKKKILFMEELVLGGQHSAETEGIELGGAGLREEEEPDEGESTEGEALDV